MVPPRSRRPTGDVGAEGAALDIVYGVYSLDDRGSGQTAEDPARASGPLPLPAARRVIRTVPANVFLVWAA